MKSPPVSSIAYLPLYWNTSNSHFFNISASSLIREKFSVISIPTTFPEIPPCPISLKPAFSQPKQNPFSNLFSQLLFTEPWFSWPLVSEPLAAMPGLKEGAQIPPECHQNPSEAHEAGYADWFLLTALTPIDSSSATQGLSQEGTNSFFHILLSFVSTQGEEEGCASPGYAWRALSSPPRFHCISHISKLSLCTEHFS